MLSPAAPEGRAGRGDDPPGTPRWPVRLPRLRRAGYGRAGPGGRPPWTPPMAGPPPATSSRRLRPCWPGGTTPLEPPDGRSASRDFVAQAAAVLARGAAPWNRGPVPGLAGLAVRRAHRQLRRRAVPGPGARPDGRGQVQEARHRVRCGLVVDPPAVEVRPGLVWVPLE